MPAASPLTRHNGTNGGANKHRDGNFFEINVFKETFKFNAAHFVAYKGFRERLHGHNYLVSIRLMGSNMIANQGYLLDFSAVKEVTRKVCRSLNEHFLCPTWSDVLEITLTTDENKREVVELVCEDGSRFVLPKDDCAMLPIVHGTTEELSIYLYGKILEGLRADDLLQRGIHTMEVTVAEAAGQEASFRFPIPSEAEMQAESLFDVRRYIADCDIEPVPCPSGSTNGAKTNGVNHQMGKCNDRSEDCQQQLSKKLQALADAINKGSLKVGSITADELESMISNNNE